MAVATCRFGRSRVVHALEPSGTFVLRLTECGLLTNQRRDVTYDDGAEPVTCTRCRRRLDAERRDGK